MPGIATADKNENRCLRRRGLRSVRAFLFFLLLVMTMNFAVLPQTAYAAKTPKLSRTRAVTAVGRKVTLKVKNYKKKVQWRSSNTYVASVSRKGVVKARHMGYTTILAKAGDVELKCFVTVNGWKNKKEKPYIFCYEVDREGRTIETNGIYNLAVVNGYNKVWKWTISDTDKAMLYYNGARLDSMTRSGKYYMGVETFLGKPGTVTVTAKSGSVTLKYKLKIHATSQDAAYAGKRQQILAKVIKPGMRAQEKCLALAKWLSDNATYVITDSDDYSILDTGRGKCTHYAKTYDFLLEGTGIPCDYITANGNPGHAWNQVQIDGQWYNVDVTSFDNTQNSRRPYNYQMFLCSNNVYGDILFTQTGITSWNQPYHNCSSRRYDFNPYYISPWETGAWVNY